MNHPMWAAIREYIAAEIKLATAWEQHSGQRLTQNICALQEQSTRMETEVRRLIDALPASQPALSPEQLRAINVQVPYGKRNDL